MLSLDVYQREVPASRRGHILTETMDGCITVYTLASTGELAKIYSVTMETSFLLKEVRFCPKTKDVLAFARYGGAM